MVAFNIRVVDTDAPLYSHRDVAAILSSAEEDKVLRCAEIHCAFFTPLIVSVDARVLGQEAECFIKLLAEKIAIKWKNHIQKYSVTQWIRAKLSFEGHKFMSTGFLN